MSKLLVADASQLALPPLAPGEEVRASGPRAAEPLAEPLQPMRPGSLTFGLFGCHDIRGRGSHVSACPHADPFILCTAAVMPPGAKPPFCAHPHCGASVASLLFKGGAITPWDNVQGFEREKLLPGGVYHVDTGAGCVHDEPIEVLFSHALIGCTYVQ